MQRRVHPHAGVATGQSISALTVSPTATGGVPGAGPWAMMVLPGSVKVTLAIGTAAPALVTSVPRSAGWPPEAA
jgi:hypothetical protein